MYILKLIDILIIIVIIVIIIIITNINAEHLTNLSNESLQNVSSIYNTDLMTLTNLNVTGSFNMIPTGAIIMWNGATIPLGWLLCDGSNGTPDLRGRFVLGSGAGKNLTERKLGNNGGEEDHTLNVTELPEHFHQLYLIKYSESISSDQFVYDDDGKYTTTQKKYGQQQTGSGDTDGDNEYQTLKAGTSGKIGVPEKGISTVGQSHNNMPPYYVLTYIMKA